LLAWLWQWKISYDTEMKDDVDERYEKKGVEIKGAWAMVMVMVFHKQVQGVADRVLENMHFDQVM
jgi:hypothetical protein